MFRRGVSWCSQLGTGAVAAATVGASQLVGAEGGLKLSTSTQRRLFREGSSTTAGGGKEAALEVEAAELAKDQEWVDNAKKLFAAACLCAPFIYYGNKKAREKYFGSEDAVALVSQTQHGKPSLGGPFSLVNTDGEPVSQADFLGSWIFFYFGFTHCPEICPVELNRMSVVCDNIAAKKPGTSFKPLFVSCDPKRDSLYAIKEYLSAFHKDFVGLVGTPEQVAQTCKSYRIYYSVPDTEKGEGLPGMDEDDYLIDHSIAIFLFDPQGRFVEFFGTRWKEDEITEKCLGFIDSYEKDPTWTNW